MRQTRFGRPEEFRIVTRAHMLAWRKPALGDGQARALLYAPAPETFKGRSDCAIFSVLLYHGLRREELVTLKVRDIHPTGGGCCFDVALCRKTTCVAEVPRI